MAMSDEHKAALAKGRKEARAIKQYLCVLTNDKGSRAVHPDRLIARIAELERRIEAEPNPLKALELRQARLDAQAILSKRSQLDDVQAHESEFIACAKSYSDRKNLTYAAWREQGVPPAILLKAGIPRTRSS